jgi:hypothetical protein
VLDEGACEDLVRALLIRTLRDLAGSDEDLKEAARAFLQSEDARRWCDLVGLDVDQLLLGLRAELPELGL